MVTREIEKKRERESRLELASNKSAWLVISSLPSNMQSQHSQNTPPPQTWLDTYVQTMKELVKYFSFKPHPQQISYSKPSTGREIFVYLLRILDYLLPANPKWPPGHLKMASFFYLRSSSTKKVVTEKNGKHKGEIAVHKCCCQLSA